MPLNDKIRKFLFSKRVVVQKTDGTMFPIHRTSLLRLTDLEIISVYNAELRGICNFYSLASNFSKLRYFAYLMEYSCLKTLANKHKSTISKVIEKFKDGKGEWGVPYETKAGLKRCYFAKYADCKRNAKPSDSICKAATIHANNINTLENRLKAKVCELCGETEGNFELHHVNKLKNLSGKLPWEKVMIAKRRKTLVVCERCHHKIHNQ